MTEKENQFYSRTENSLDNWQTPKYFFELLEKEMELIIFAEDQTINFQFNLDPASSDENALCEKHFTKKDNGLIKSWRGHNVFLNPPFSSMEEWVKKAFNEGQKANTIVAMILPPRTDTKYWHKYIMEAYMVLFCKGRVNFLISCYKCKRLVDKTIKFKGSRICEDCYSKLTNKKKSGSSSTFPLVIVIFKKHSNSYILIKSFYHKEKDILKENQKSRESLDKWIGEEN